MSNREKRQCPNCGSSNVIGDFDEDQGPFFTCEDCDHNWSEQKAKKLLAEMTEPEMGKLLNTMARAIELISAELNVEKPYFALVLFNQPKIGQYVSNCERDGIIEAMRELANRLEEHATVERVAFEKGGA